jgi:hypothetical protein
MMSLGHRWGWQSPQTDSPIHIRHKQSVWAHWYAVHGHTVASLYSYTHTTWLKLRGFLVTCGVKMLSVRHGWGWQPPQNDFLIQNRHIQSVWAHWYADHGHTVATLHSHTHTSWLSFLGSGSLVESKWCHYIMVETDSCLKLAPASTLNTYKVFEHIDMLSMGIQ